jgi:hypothetical protein
MSQHVEHFEPICTRCLLEAADVLLIVLFIALVAASLKRRLTSGPPTPGASPR